MADCYVYINGKRQSASFNGYTSNGRASVTMNNSRKILKARNVQYAKGKRRKDCFGKSNDVLYTARKGRFRRRVAVIPTRYRAGEEFGNFKPMLFGPNKDKYKNAVCGFNDNGHEWGLANPQDNTTFLAPWNHSAGGGNACARPAQLWGDAIGIPTGPFQNLNQPIHTACGEVPAGSTARDVIDAAFVRIIKLFCNNPNKDILYYSVNSTDPPDSLRIGLAIFAGAVGDDVIDYITDSLQKLSDGIHEANYIGDPYKAWSMHKPSVAA